MNISISQEIGPEPLKGHTTGQFAGVERKEKPLSGANKDANAVVQQFDHVRMKNLMALVSLIKKSSTFSQAIFYALDRIPKVVSCQNGLCVVFKRSLLDGLDQQKLIVQKDLVDNQYCDLVAISDHNMPFPAFTKFLDAQKEICNYKSLSVPILDEKRNLLCTFQVESKAKAGERSLIKAKQYVGFSSIDRHVVQLVATVLKLKLDQINSIQRKIEMEDEVLQTIKIAGIICNQRSQPELIKQFKLLLPAFFGFESVGVMMRDVKTNMIFSINELTEEETTEWMSEQLQKRGLRSETQLTRQDERDIAVLLDQYRETRRISFPNNLGVSGRVFHAKEIMYSNNAANERKFYDDVDNQSEVKDVKNYLIGPVFGHFNDSLNLSQQRMCHSEQQSEQ